MSFEEASHNKTDTVGFRSQESLERSICRDRKWMVGARAGGGGGETESQIRELRKFWRGMHNNVNISILNYALKNGQDGKFYVMCIL